MHVNDCGPDAAWPEEIARLHSILALSKGSIDRDGERGALWQLLFQTLLRFLRSHARHTGSHDVHALEDIAAEKALELLHRAESGAWDLTGRSASEVAGYISTAARYGWIDHVQRTGREVPASPSGEPTSPHPLLSVTRPVDRVEGAELARAARDCVELLPERGRRVWFFRAFYDMSSEDIAQHPDVRVNAPHVDVLVQRARAALRDCLRRKGHVLEDLGPTAFVALWEMLESLARRESRPEPALAERSPT